MNNIIEFFDNLADTEINSQIIDKLSSLYNCNLNDSYEVVRLLLSTMTDESLEFSDNTRLLTLTEVKDFTNKTSKLIPLFQTKDYYICYNISDNNFALYDTFNQVVNKYSHNLFELLEEELASNNFIMPKGQFISLPFLYLKNNQENFCVFGYDMISEKDKYCFRVNNLIINSEKSYDCKITIPIDMEQYKEYYTEILDAYSNVSPDNLDELDRFLKSDMTDPSLLEKYEKIVQIANQEEYNIKTATQILNDEFDAGMLTENRCLDIIHEYNKHANIGRLYEMTLNYIKANNI